MAASHGNKTVINLLLECGANSNHCCKRSPLMWEAYSGHLETLKLLLEKGAYANRKLFRESLSREETALSLAREGPSRWKKKVSLNKLLLSRGEQYELSCWQDKEGEKEVIKYFLKQGVKE